jgi:hypothetical protein
MKRKNQKTYGRFLGTIFFGGCRALFVAGLQWVAQEKTRKSEK